MALILTTTLLCGGGDIGCKKASASSTTDADRLVVHEWGTFTSFEGADGATMEGMQHESEALPAFVHSRLSAEASPLASASRWRVSSMSASIAKVEAGTSTRLSRSRIGAG